MSVRDLTPLIVAGVFIAAATLASGFGDAKESHDDGHSAAVKRFNQRTLHTVDGVTIHQAFNPDSRTVSVSSHGRPLKDGAYKIDNGGSIRVTGGRISWDSLGVIARLNSGDSQALGTLPA
jgi:hypothetical protein